MPELADHGLLMGFLAIRMGFADREAVVRAMNAWASEPGGSFGKILVAQGVLADSQRELLEMAAESHLRRHGGLAGSLHALDAGPTLGELIQSGIDPGVTTAAPRGPVEEAGARTGPEGVPARPSAGRYRVLRPHASGGLGEVFVARDEELGREVALKEIHPRLAGDPRLRARFVLEAEITGALEHPGIVPVYGLGRYEDGRPFYAMRFIRGESLMQAIERCHTAEGSQHDEQERQLGLRKLLNCFVAVSNAVAYAHSRGVIHRDLKPENVMLGPYGETLVVDWGLAKLVGRPDEQSLAEVALSPASAAGLKPTQLGSTLGTVFYMSPEQAAGQIDRLGPASDVYALGVMLYVILTCKAPFEGTDGGEVLQRVIEGRFTPPRRADPRVPAALEAVCLKAMALEPANRYNSATELAADVESWLADGPVRAWQEPWRVRAGRWTRRHRPLVSGVAAALLVAVVSLAAGVFLLASANHEIRRSQSLAEKREQEARGNLTLALASVDNFLVRVSGDARLRAHNLEPLRRQLLETAVGFYERFTREKPEDPELRYQWAEASFRLANILADIDSKAHAMETLGRAIEVLESLVQEHPDDAQYKSLLAKCRVNLGIYSAESGRMDEARLAYKAAMAISDGLLAIDPHSEDYRVDRANLHNNMGNVELATGRFDRAEAEFARAVAIRRALADAAPEDTNFQAALASNETNLGAVLQRQGRLAEAARSMEAARAIQARLVQGHGDQPDFRRELAATCTNLATVLDRLPGREADAEAALNEAVGARRRLVQEHPDVVQYQFGLGRDLLNLVALYAGRGRLPEAESTAKEAVSVHRRLATEHGDVPDYKNGLAAALNGLANVYSGVHRPKEAEGAYREAIAIRRELVQKHADLPDYQFNLAIACENLAGSLVVAGRLPEAQTVYGEAIANLEALAKKHPRTAAYSTELGAACTRLSCLLTGRPEAALANARKAIAAFGNDLEQVQRDATLKSRLLMAHWTAAESLAQLGKHEESVADWDAALELAPADRRVLLRLGRVEAQARLGKYAEASAEASALIPATKGAGEPSYRLAAVFALAGASAAKDSSLIPGERDRLSRKNAASAISLLEQARAAGHFQPAAQRKTLRQDPSFHSLQAMPEFQRLLERIEANQP